MSNSSDELQLEEQMVPAQRIVVFQVAADSDSGFTAHAAGHSIFIQGESIDELERAGADAVLCYFGNTKPVPQFELRFENDNPRIA